MTNIIIESIKRCHLPTTRHSLLRLRNTVLFERGLSTSLRLSKVITSSSSSVVVVELVYVSMLNGRNGGLWGPMTVVSWLAAADIGGFQPQNHKTHTHQHESRFILVMVAAVFQQSGGKQKEKVVFRRRRQ